MVFKTNIDGLDEKLALENGQLWVVAAKPRIGKSAFLVHLAIQAMEQDFSFTYIPALDGKQHVIEKFRRRPDVPVSIDAIPFYHDIDAASKEFNIVLVDGLPESGVEYGVEDSVRDVYRNVVDYLRGLARENNALIFLAMQMSGQEEFTGSRTVPCPNWVYGMRSDGVIQLLSDAYDKLYDKIRIHVPISRQSASFMFTTRFDRSTGKFERNEESEDE